MPIRGHADMRRINREVEGAAEPAPPLKDCAAARGGFGVALASCFVPPDARFMLARFATTWETHPTARALSLVAAYFVLPPAARFMPAHFATTWEMHPAVRTTPVDAPTRSDVGTEDEKGALRGMCVTGGAGHEGEDARRAGASLERVLGDNAGVRAERFEQRGHVLGRAQGEDLDRFVRLVHSERHKRAEGRGFFVRHVEGCVADGGEHIALMGRVYG